MADLNLTQEHRKYIIDEQVEKHNPHQIFKYCHADDHVIIKSHETETVKKRVNCPLTIIKPNFQYNCHHGV